MRKVVIGILLAASAITPAIAQDNGNDRWHRDQQNGRGEGHQQREGRQQQQQQQAPQQQAPQQQARGGRWNGNFDRQQGAPGAQPQQQMQVQQGPRNWNRQGFERRGVPQNGVQEQAVNRGPLQVEQNRNGGWTRNYGYRQGQAIEGQQRPNGAWYGQRGVVQQQYRGGGGYASGGWNRNWRNDSRYDWRHYRESHRSRFHLGLYIDPFGYGYQPFAIGYRLPPIYFGQQYWIDPALYELPYPPPGTQWVRYWNDALLVDMYTGQVVDVIQGFFW